MFLSDFSLYVLLCRKLERLESRRQELEAVGSKIAPSKKLDAQSQAGKSMTDSNSKSYETEEEQALAMKLEEAEKIIRRLRRENEENRRELATIRANLSKSMGNGNGRQLGGGGGNNHRGGGGVGGGGGGSSGGGGGHHRSHNQQQMEFVSHRHCTNGGSNGGGRLEKEAQLVGRPAPSLPNLRNNGTSSGYSYSNGSNGNNGNHRRFNGNGNHYYRANKDEVPEGGGGGGRKYRGTRANREAKQ
ncbi:hypothetical protein C0J52_08443 [Blattella germanica]|nr:hypothetical protein C0J52_08443 [Blattella germanica]